MEAQSKKIVFLSHVDINLYLFRLPIMEYLVETGWDVYALVPEGNVSRKFSELGIKHIPYEIDRKSLNPAKEAKVILSLKKKLGLIRPDILHTFTVKPNIYGSIAGRISGVPRIINTVTGLGSFFIENDLKARIIRKLILNLYKISFKFSDIIVFQNRDDMNFFLKDRVVSEEKCVLIKGSGIDTSVWVPEKRLKNDGVVRIITIGRLLVHKGIHEYIEVARLLKSKYHSKVEFLLIGDFYDGNPYSINKKLLNGAIEKGIINYYRWLPIQQVKELMKISDIFVLLSYREGIPRVGIEALSLGMPIVTTNVAGCKEIVEDGKNGFLVPPKNINETVNKLEILINNQSLRRKMSIYSREKAIREFDIRLIVRKYMELYQNLLRRGKQSDSN